MRSTLPLERLHNAHSILSVGSSFFPGPLPSLRDQIDLRAGPRTKTSQSLRELNSGQSQIRFRASSKVAPTRADERSKKKLSVTKQFKKLKKRGAGLRTQENHHLLGDLNVPLFRADTPGGRTKKGHN